MEYPSLSEIIIAILKSPTVIGVVIVAILYIALVSYVVNYRKKPPKPRKLSTEAPKPRSQASEDDGAVEDVDNDDEEMVE